MSDLLAALFSYLNQDAEIRKIVGSRIYPMVIPQSSAIPALVYCPTAAKHDDVLGGSSGYIKQNMQISCHDTTFKKARKLSQLIRRKLQDYHGDMFGVRIEAVFIETDFVLGNGTAINYKEEQFIAVLEFCIHYNEIKEK